MMLMIWSDYGLNIKDIYYADGIVLQQLPRPIRTHLRHAGSTEQTTAPIRTGLLQPMLQAISYRVMDGQSDRQWICTRMRRTDIQT